MQPNLCFRVRPAQSSTESCLTFTSATLLAAQTSSSNSTDYCKQASIFSGSEGLRTSNLVHRWSTKTRTYHHQSRSRSRGLSDRCWPISRERKKPRNHKISRKVAHPTGNNARQVQGQKVKVTRLINAETEIVSHANFKLDRRFEHALSTVMACEVGLLHECGDIPCRSHSAATQLVNECYCARNCVYVTDTEQSACSQSSIPPLCPNGIHCSPSLRHKTILAEQYSRRQNHTLFSSVFANITN